MSRASLHILRDHRRLRDDLRRLARAYRTEARQLTDSERRHARIAAAELAKMAKEAAAGKLVLASE